MATVGKIKADLQLSTGQFKRDVDKSKEEMRALGAEIRERKKDYLQVERAAKAQADQAKWAAQEARRAAQEQAIVAREARLAAAEAKRNAKELAEAAKSASSEQRKHAEEEANYAKRRALEMQEEADRQAKLAAEARRVRQEKSLAAREAREIANEARRDVKEQVKLLEQQADAAKKVVDQTVPTSLVGQDTSPPLPVRREARGEMADMVEAIHRVEKEYQEASKAAKKAAEDQKRSTSDTTDTIRQQGETAQQTGAKQVQSAREVAKAQREAEKAAKAHQAALYGIGTASATVFALLAVFIAVTTMNAAEMEQAMKDLEAITQATASEMERAKSAAENFGPQNGFIPAESVRTITEFNKAGVEMARLVNGELKDAQDLMVAGEVSVGEGANYAASQLSIYRDEALSLKEIANVAVGAANASTSSVRELTYASAALGSVGAMLGQEFEEVNTVMATFSQNGLRGSDAGTSLKTALLQLASPTQQQKRVLEELNLQFFDSRGKMKSLSEIAEELQNKLTRFNEKSRTAILSEIVGQDGVRAMGILYKEGAEGIEEMNRKMNDVTAAEVAATKLDSLNGQIKIMRAEAAVAADRFGGDFIPAVRGGVEAITSLIQAYNNLSSETRSTITTTVLVGAAMTGTAATLALATVGVGKLTKAIGGLNGALTLLGRHPVILAMTVLAGVATAVYVSYEKNAEAARKFAEAQTELNKAISESANTTNPEAIAEYQKKADEIEKLGKRYEDLAKIVNDPEKNAVGDVWWQKWEHVDKARDEMEKLDEQMKGLGVTAGNYKRTVDDLRDSINSNSQGVLELTRAKSEELAGQQDTINSIQALKREYQELTANEYLNAEQKRRLQDVTDELKGLIPGLIAVEDAQGNTTIRNTSLIDDKVLAIQKAMEADKEWAMTTIDNGIAAAEAEAKILQQRLDNIIAFGEAVNSVNSNMTLGDNQRTRQSRFAENEQARLEEAVSLKNVDIASLKAQKNRITSGNFDPSREKGGSDNYTIPTGENEGKGGDAVQERYQQEIAAAKQAYERGVTSRAQYVERLKSIESEFSSWLAQNYSERYSLQNDISSNSFQHSVEWIETEKRAMRQRGATSQEIAQMEADAWARVAARDIYLAADRKRAYEELQRSKHDLAAATFQKSEDWIAAEEKAMRDAGSSDVDVAKMVYDAWGRVNARRGQGVYLLEDEKQAAEELQNSYERLVDAMEQDLRRAREYDRDRAIEALETERDAAVDAIQAKLDALDEQIEREDYLLSLKKEQEELARLESERANVAAIKNKRRVEYDENGNAQLVWTADDERLTELDKQIGDQKQRIADMERDHERRQQRAHLEQQLRKTQEHYDKKLEAEKAYWTALLTEERINSDLQYAIAKEGMDKTLAHVGTYLDGMVAEYQEAQAKIMSMGNISLPSVGGGGLPTASTEDVRAKMTENSSKWHSASPAERQRLHEENKRLGTSIGGKYDSSTGKWTFHTGVDRVPGTTGEDVPGVTLQAGERVLSISQNQTFEKFMRMIMSMPSQTEMRMRSLVQSNLPASAGTVSGFAGRKIEINAPLIGQIVAPPGMDVNQVSDLAADKAVRKLVETIDTL